MMSTVPEKSQPLHNFALSHLKWKSKGVVEHRKHTKNPFKDGVYASNNDRKLEKSEMMVRPSSHPDQTTANNNQSKTKILIKITVGSNNKASEEGKQEERKGEEDYDEEPNGKTRNLRPRKPMIRMSLNENGGAVPRSGGSALQENIPQSQSRNRAEGEASGAAEKKVKRAKFSISLLREEIEEDIFIMTGSKPVRRPKKRAKNIQKQLDNLFPGLWLSSITPDSYKVPENPTKG